MLVPAPPHTRILQHTRKKYNVASTAISLFAHRDSINHRLTLHHTESACRPIKIPSPLFLQFTDLVSSPVPVAAIILHQSQTCQLHAKVP